MCTLDWSHTYTCFDDTNTIAPETTKCYVDSEIDGQVTCDIFDPIFQSLKQFQAQKSRIEFRHIPTSTGDECGLMREWYNDTERLQVWIINDGWNAMYGTQHTFLIVGNINGHPNVVIPEFTFGNSDGSTDDVFDCLTSTFEQIKDIMQACAITYIWNQKH